MEIRRVATLSLITLFLAGGCSAKPSPSAPSTSPPSHVSTQQPAARATPQIKAPLIPGNLQMDESGEPILKVYVVKEKASTEMPIEEYLLGVLAGEMKNDWPLEALKAQAIIARTFALKFIEDKGGSMYDGADVSTDIQEAQAYDPDGINERVREAIDETRGQVIAYQGELTYTWFHSHAGGITALAKEGLEWESEEPPYIQSVESTESQNAPDDLVEWTASFPLDQVAAAIKEMGFTFEDISGISIGKKGPSGRTVTFDINGEAVSAPSLRIRLDPTVFKSTLLTEAAVKDGAFTLTGKGFGHGVGMSQWGAYELAEQGLSAEEIIETYYTDIEVVEMW